MVGLRYKNSICLPFIEISDKLEKFKFYSLALSKIHCLGVEALILKNGNPCKPLILKKSPDDEIESQFVTK